MAYSGRHRFLKKYDLPYYCKLSVKGVADLSGLDQEDLQIVYDLAFLKYESFNKAMREVYIYANRKLKTLIKE